jgi:hypothetical protein
MICRQYSFQKPTPKSQGNYKPDTHISNIDCFLSRDTCVSTIHMNRPILRKCAFLPIENHFGQEVFLSKLTKLSQGNNLLHAPPSYVDVFLLRDTCVYSSDE